MFKALSRAPHFFLLSACLLGLNSQAGIAQLLTGNAQTIASPVPLTADSAAFGEHLAWVDVDGDGRDDLVTVHFDRQTSTHRVMAYLAGIDGQLSPSSQNAVFTDEPTVVGCDIDPTNPGEEVLVGIPRADVSFNGTVPRAGVVLVYDWGTQPFPTLLATWSQVDAPNEDPESGDNFGTAMAPGDYNGDGVCDLAISAPNEDFGGIANAGVVHLRYGPLSGGSWSDPLSKEIVMGAQITAGDRFGSALASGSLDGDAIDDLVVGNPEDDEGATNAGSIWIIYPSSRRGGFSGTVQTILASDVGLEDTEHNGFGAALATGDLNGDGSDDLAVGSPAFHIGGLGGPSSGSVTILFAGDSGLSLSEVEHRTISSTGGSEQGGDDFGESLAIARTYGGVGSDLLVGAPGAPGGGLVAAYRGDTELTFAVAIEQTDLGEVGEPSDGFGESLVFGDPRGRRTLTLAIGAPGEDFDPPPALSPGIGEATGAAQDLTSAIVRGTPAGGDLGVVHVVPTVDLLRSAEMIVLEDEPFLGQTISRIGLPRHNAAGLAALRLLNDASLDLIARTDQLIASGPNMSAEVGIDENGNTAWLDLDEGELRVSSRGVVFEDGAPSPVGGLFAFTATDQLLLRGNEQLFLLTELQAPLARRLLRSDLLNGTSEVLLSQGDVVDNETIFDITQIAASSDAQHWGAVVDLAGGQGVVVNGELLLSSAERGISMIEVLQATVGSGGRVAIAATTGFAGLVGGSEWVLQSDGGVLGNLPLDLYEPRSVAISAFDELTSVWGREGLGGEALGLSCPLPVVQRAGIGAAADNIRGTVPSFASRVLIQGDPLDTDADGFADATVVAIDTSVGGAPEVSGAGEIVLRIDLRRDSEPEIVRKSLVRLRSPVCPSFADGFESGNTSAWSTTTG